MMDSTFLSQCEQYVISGGMPNGNHFEKVNIPKHGLLDIDPAEALNYLDEFRVNSFSEQLIQFIDRTGKKDSDIYKKALIDRRLFSKIRSNKNYIPAKKTVLALCLSLELSREDTDRLLSSAGYSLSRTDDYDLVIAFCIEKNEYNLFDINEVLAHFGFDCF